MEERENDIVKQGTSEINIVRIKNQERMNELDRVIVEYPLTIFLNDQEFVTLLCSPTKMDCLAVGFLRSEGLVMGADDLESVRVDEERGMVFVETRSKTDLVEKLYGKRTITSGCGKGTVFFNVLDSLQNKPVESSQKIAAGSLHNLMSELHENSLLYKTTGGVHIAALADPNQLLFCHEDIGRHNAVDKIVGECVLNNLPIDDKILLSSGRLTSEMVIKGAKLRFPFVVSRSAPTSLSVQLARELGITLVGFVRGRRMNIYSHEERID